MSCDTDGREARAGRMAQWSVCWEAAPTDSRGQGGGFIPTCSYPRGGATDKGPVFLSPTARHHLHAGPGTVWELDTTREPERPVSWPGNPPVHTMRAKPVAGHLYFGTAHRKVPLQRDQKQDGAACLTSLHAHPPVPPSWCPPLSTLMLGTPEPHLWPCGSPRPGSRPRVEKSCSASLAAPSPAPRRRDAPLLPSPPHPFSFSFPSSLSF